MLFTAKKDDIKRTKRENVSKSIVQTSNKSGKKAANMNFHLNSNPPVYLGQSLAFDTDAQSSTISTHTDSSHKSKFLSPHSIKMSKNMEISNKKDTHSSTNHTPPVITKATLEPLIEQETRRSVSKAVEAYMKKTAAIQQTQKQDNQKLKTEMQQYVQQSLQERMQKYMSSVQQKTEQDKKHLEGVLCDFVKERVETISKLREAENNTQTQQISLKLKNIDEQIAQLFSKQKEAVTFKDIDALLQDKVSKSEMEAFVSKWNLDNMQVWTEKYIKEWMCLGEDSITEEDNEKEEAHTGFEQIIEPAVARIIHRVLKYDRTHEESDNVSVHSYHSNHSNMEYEHAYENTHSPVATNDNPLYEKPPIAPEPIPEEKQEVVSLGCVYKSESTGMFENELRNKTAKKWTKLGNGVQTGNIIDMFLDKKNRKIYIAGHFKHVDSIPMENIAVYDMKDKMWKHVGDGVPQVTSSIAVDEDNERVFVGGIFSKVGKGAGQVAATNIAMYSVKEKCWKSLGDGLNRDCTSIVFDAKRNALYAAGSFTASGKTEMRYVGMYDLTSNVWKSLPGGSVNAPCRVLLKSPVKDELYLGGLFTHANDDSIHVSYIAKYHLETNQWYSLSGGLQGYCNALALDETHQSLYVGGTFTSAGEPSKSIDAHHIARYDTENGIWDNMDGGVNNVVQSIYYDAKNNLVYTGGSFTNTYENGLELNYIAKYDPEQKKWSALENYFPNSNQKSDEPNPIGLDGVCKVLSMDEKTLYIAGKFKNAGNVSTNSIARYAVSRSMI